MGGYNRAECHFAELDHASFFDDAVSETCLHVLEQKKIVSAVALVEHLVRLACL